MGNPLHRLARIFRYAAGGVLGIFRSKYIEIILAVALFVLLDTGVLVINFYTSYQIANDAHAIKLASQMGTLSQSLLHELYQVEEDANTPDADYFETIDRFAKTFKIFDETLDAFIYGGALIGEGQGQDALLRDTAYRNASASLLKEAEAIWKPYRSKVTPIVYAYFNDASREEVLAICKSSIDYARQESDKLLQLMQSFTTAVEGVAKRKAERLRLIQAIGITLAIINFFLILFHFIRRLRRSDAMVEQSRKETQDILENVNEGLMLLDQNYIIGSQHSTSLHGLFNKPSLAGQNFIDLLRPLVSEMTLDTVEDYTEILFSPRVNESLVSDLNPLKQVEINLTTEAAAFDIRYFSFQFSRVYQKNDFHSLLVTIKDITEQVQLSERLKTANDRANKEIDMLLGIIHVENLMLTDFLKTTKEGLVNVNNILKQPTQGQANLKGKLETIFRIIHKLKGDSTALGLDFVIEKFHSLESAIADVKTKNDICGEDFLPLVVHLNQLISDFTIITKLQKRMRTFDPPKQEYEELLPQAIPTPDVQTATSLSQWEKHLSNLVNRIANDYDKEAVLDLSECNLSLLSKDQLEPVRDIIVQSLRNSVAHGIESPITRENAGKPTAGNLKVNLKKAENGLELTIRDDGQGIDLERVKARAVSCGMATENQISNWQRSKLLSLIFLQGFTTAQESDIHAGHGVGMDLIKSRLELLKGQAKVKFQVGRFTEFHYFFKAAAPITQ